MNARLEQNIIEQLHQLDDAHLHKVLEFIEQIKPQSPELPKITGLFAHLNVDDTELDKEVAQLKCERQNSLKLLSDTL
ncbi:hypothetical protein QTA56_06545 [Acinetobacter sp. VNH17]|uniref:Uncharacterized protein n=1 Tax=Acinetobacter thutiue TaxID=2998078 RepID=A0ABT7WMI6_9GAMM|nr:hypothetical protein [Acinetobacter thutiue]MCY6411799.1 hypothetical protein [Acinetobacter thutiue]MDN0013901.1 hypothetical protein [Acinetobacter thutiue]